MDHSFGTLVSQALNFMQLGWTSGPLPKRFAGKTVREANQLAGLRRSLLPGQRRPLPLPSSFLEVRATRRSSAVPDTLDWRKKDNKNWLNPIITQGDCGSCYTIATIEMLTARNKIRVGNPAQEAFSVMFPLFCSEYNQGCDGGYGFLQTKWSEDVGLVPEKCNPFNQGGGSCSATKHCDLGAKRYRATNHHYVGGFYG